MADFEQSLKIYENSSVYVCRADYKSKWGDTSGAISDYTVAPKYRPKDASTYKARGELRLRAGDLAGAQSDFVQAAKFTIHDKVRLPVVF